MIRFLPVTSFSSCRSDRLTHSSFLFLLPILILAGCAPQKPILIPVVESVPAPEPQYEELKNEIARLEKIIAEKEEVIKNQQLRQQSQAHVLRETNKEAARAQVKLHRLATKPSTASAIAEVEASLEHLKQTRLSSFDQILQMQAQRLLDTATLFYSKEQYAAAMSHVAQANSFIGLIQDEKRKKITHVDPLLLEFHVPVKLRTTKNVNLRKEPNSHARVLSTLKKDTHLIANANQGPWVRIQIDKTQGWVLYTMLERDESRTP
ncbi:MAG: SH3 domain-containing protein [Nitrosomonas sp.]|nr:SH3 domain-containing protein [Nitrosomonas sp.]